MRSVSLKELADWVEKNKLHTWHPDAFANGTFGWKYIRFSLDTRDMQVWSVTLEGGFKPHVFVRDDNEDDGKTILDVLDQAVKMWMEK